MVKVTISYLHWPKFSPPNKSVTSVEASGGMVTNLVLPFHRQDELQCLLPPPIVKVGLMLFPTSLCEGSSSLFLCFTQIKFVRVIQCLMANAKKASVSMGDFLTKIKRATILAFSNLSTAIPETALPTLQNTFQ